MPYPRNLLQKLYEIPDIVEVTNLEGIDERDLLPIKSGLNGFHDRTGCVHDDCEIIGIPPIYEGNRILSDLPVISDAEYLAYKAEAKFSAKADFNLV